MLPRLVRGANPVGTSNTESLNTRSRKRRKRRRRKGKDDNEKTMGKTR